MTTSWVQTQAGHARKRSSIPLTSTCCRFRKNRLVVPFQLNRVRVKRRRTSCKNTTVLNHRQTSFFSHIEFVRSRALAGCESSNERKRNGSHSKAPTSWTPEFVGLKVRQTSHEAPSQDGESASPPGTPAHSSRGGLRSIPFPILTNTPYWIRVDVKVTNGVAQFNARAWQNGTPEPGSWQVTYSDNSPLAAGNAGIMNDWWTTPLPGEQIRVSSWSYAATGLAVPAQ